MIDVLLSAVLVVGIATLAIAVRTLWSSRRSEGLGEGRYDLLRDQHDRLELLREERRVLLEELERESQERQQFTELLGEVSPQLVEGLKQARKGSVENARASDEQKRERLRLEEKLRQLEEELERERQRLVEVRQEAERLGQEHQRLTEELAKERGGHQELRTQAENLQQERLRLEEELQRLDGELEQERQKRSEVQRWVEQLEQEGRERSGVEQQAERTAQSLQQLRVDFEREREERLEAQRRAEQLEQERLSLERELVRSKEEPGGGRSEARSWWRRPVLVVGLLFGALAAWFTSLMVALNLLSP
jgi:chromosome segregation ATPase